MSRGKPLTEYDERQLRGLAANYPESWILTKGSYGSSYEMRGDRTHDYPFIPVRITPEEGVTALPPGYWVYAVPTSLRSRFDEEGRPLRTTPPVPIELGDADAGTHRLVYSSVPRYRNHDCCPVPGCREPGMFQRMEMCCPQHGAWARHQQPAVVRPRSSAA